MENSSKSSKRISTELLIILVPMIAAFLIVVALIIFSQSRTIIIDLAVSGLAKESEANANAISTKMENIKGYLDGLAGVLESSDYANDKDIKEALQPSMHQFEDVNDIYLGFADKTFIDGGDWVPDAGYDPTTRGWYINGLTTNSVVFGEPDIDMDTKEAVVNGIRRVTFKDGRVAVLSSDIFLKNISEEVSEYTPLGTGKSMLFAGSNIIGSPEADYVGADASSLTNDKFITSVYNGIISNSVGTVVNLTGNDGQAYFVSYTEVPGTGWILVSYVKKGDVLKQLASLQLITIVLTIIMLIVSTLIILYLVNNRITKPVNGLTSTITSIAGGDFTVNIKTDGRNNEIGTMNKNMAEYVARMRGTLGEMKELTNRMSSEAENSRSASEIMSEQATQQSESMEQIHQAMDGVANSVTELASNATDLAETVSDLTDQGGETSAIMNELIDKANKGQKDMANVQKNMDTISESMSEMNEVVDKVDEAANKINSIVEMINSISSQTNLLSLNASIEAARAGEAGRGFAVVATEIGNLANESARATTEISSIIADITLQIKTLSERSQSSSNDIAVSSEAVSVAGDTFAEIFRSLDHAGTTVQKMISKMDEVNDIASSVAAIAEEQSASTEEVCATVETAAVSANNVAEESRNVDSSAVAVADSAAKISEFVDMFTI